MLSKLFVTESVMDSNQTETSLPSTSAEYFEKDVADDQLRTEHNGRIRATIVKPIVYGSEAWPLGSEREDKHTHQWTVYLRSYDHEDMSVYVRRVQFKLHDSYVEPVRNITMPPYSITETGWGEFKIPIKIFFVDGSEKPVTLCHGLKLFNNSGPVNSEFYDELLFTNPTVKMYPLLTNPRFNAVISHKNDYEQMKDQDLELILSSKQKVRQEIAELRAHLQASQAEIKQLRLKRK